MLAKAHIAVGMAAAFTIIHPDNFSEALPVVAGASLGCLICDLDCENKKEKTDSSRWRVAMAVVCAAALIEDHLLEAGMWKSLSSSGSYIWAAGLAGFLLTCTFATISGHREFSHSLPALALETVSLWLIFPSVAKAFAIAFISHLILDMMNKRPVRILYPAEKGFCLGWFYADKLANRAFAAVGSLWLLAEILICLKS